MLVLRGEGSTGRDKGTTHGAAKLAGSTGNSRAACQPVALHLVAHLLQMALDHAVVLFRIPAGQ
jgi:hypothetical protein